MMKVGIDSYCYHRFFGEVYPQQEQPGKRMTLEEFLARARELGVDGVSLESCFVPNKDPGYLRRIGGMLDDWGMDRVYAWGHPDGLERGLNQDAYGDMIAAFAEAQSIGAKVMRVVGSSLRFRDEPHEPQIERLTAMFREAVKVAEDHGIKMAVENHIDFTSDEMVRLLDGVGSPYLGINFDTGNFLRMLDDPVKGMKKLAKRVYATHIKDLKVQKGVAADEWYFFSSAPVGDGVVDNLELARLLKEAGYEGFLAVEIDCLHTDYGGDEDAAVEKSVQELRRIVEAVGLSPDWQLLQETGTLPRFFSIGFLVRFSWSVMTRRKPGDLFTDAAIPAPLDEYVFLSPECIHEVARVVQSARETDLYFRNLIAGLSVRLAYIIDDVPKPLRRRDGGDGQATVCVRIDRGAVRSLEVGREPQEKEAHVLVTTEYKTAKKLFLGESRPASTVLSRRLKAEPVNGFRGWPKLAAQSIVISSNVLRVMRKVPTVFEPEPVSASG